MVNDAWPVHHAAYDDDLQRFEQLTVRWTAADWIQQDACGNTCAHVAALRRAHRCLNHALRAGHASGAPVFSMLNAAGWTILQEAIANRDEATARLVFFAEHSLLGSVSASTSGTSGAPDVDVGPGLRDASVATLIEKLHSMPDFRMTIKWKFGSSLFGHLMRTYAPHDTYQITKCGDALRLDGELTGMSIGTDGGYSSFSSMLPRYHRGGFTVLLYAEGGTPTLSFVQHDTKTFAHVYDASHDLQGLFGKLYGTGVRETQRVEQSEASFTRSKTKMGRPAREKVSGVETHIWEATSRMRKTKRIKGNSYAIGGAFERYLAAGQIGQDEEKSKMVHIPLSSSDAFGTLLGKQRSPAEGDAGSVLRARLWLAPDFPLKVYDMILLLRIVAVPNKHARRLATALEQFASQPVFPMKISVPLMMTSYLSLVCSEYKPLAGGVDAGMFTVPEGYRELPLEQLLMDAMCFDVA